MKDGFPTGCHASSEGGRLKRTVRRVYQEAGCEIYDGLTYGDGDGLLSDETISVSQAEIRRLATLCGWTTIYQPELTVAATDCGGNIGFATMTFRAGLKLLPGICGP